MVLVQILRVMGICSASLHDLRPAHTYRAGRLFRNQESETSEYD
ncbi:MAG: hypothetical protein ACI9G1_001700 [Pirellulaceae bacterium]|jgi:hypothetical protein